MKKKSLSLCVLFGIFLALPIILLAEQLEVIISITHPLNKSELLAGFNSLEFPKKPELELLPDTRWHMTLIYVNIPIPSGTGSSAFKQKVAQDLLQIAQRALSTASCTMPFVRFELWNRFYVATYRSNRQVDQKINEIGKKIQLKYPRAQLVHKNFKPHISLVRFNPLRKNPRKRLASLRESLAPYDNRKPKNIVTPITINNQSKIKIEMH